MTDPIVDEARRARDAHAARFDYDPDAIFRDVKERERKRGLRFVAGAARLAPPAADRGDQGFADRRASGTLTGEE